MLTTSIFRENERAFGHLGTHTVLVVCPRALQIVSFYSDPCLFHISISLQSHVLYCNCCMTSFQSKLNLNQSWTTFSTTLLKFYSEICLITRAQFWTRSIIKYILFKSIAQSMPHGWQIIYELSINGNNCHMS